MKIRTAILISGGGSNMEALIQSVADDENHPAEIVLVISNQAEAGGLAKAKRHGIPAIVIDHKKFKSRENFERKLHGQLGRYKVDLICNAGFMRILTPWFVSRWEGRQLNIHPSLLPKFKGLNTHQRALDAGETHHGCTVHWVNDGVDDGEIIDQASVKVLKNDTAESLAARVLTKEHSLYSKVLRKITEDIVSRYVSE